MLVVTAVPTARSVKRVPVILIRSHY